MRITSKMQEKYPVVDTVLFKHCAARLPMRKHKQLRDALQAVVDMKDKPGKIPNLNQKIVDQAFTWRLTPQGHDFWHQLNSIVLYGHSPSGKIFKSWARAEGKKVTEPLHIF